MLDAETKSRIDSARDILVGKVPDLKSQVEQITIALIYKFMDDMDRQSEEFGGKATFFTGDFKKYRWANLLDKRLGGHERLLLYAEGIEKMNENKNIPQLFRDIFKGVFLPYRDPETLNLFLKEIAGFSYDHSERLGDAFEYLLSVLGTQGDAGQFRTVALLRMSKATCNQSLVSMSPLPDSRLKPEFLFHVIRIMYDQIRALTGDGRQQQRRLGDRDEGEGIGGAPVRCHSGLDQESGRDSDFPMPLFAGMTVGRLVTRCRDWSGS